MSLGAYSTNIHDSLRCFTISFTLHASLRARRFIHHCSPTVPVPSFTRLFKAEVERQDKLCERVYTPTDRNGRSSPVLRKRWSIRNSLMRDTKLIANSRAVIPLLSVACRRRYDSLLSARINESFTRPFVGSVFTTRVRELIISMRPPFAI